MITRLEFLLLVILLHTAGPAKAGAPQQDQRELAQQLLNENASERSKALSAVRSIEPGKIGPELRAALLAVLDNGNKIVQDVRRSGGITEDSLDPQLHARVCQTVAELREPSAIPALARGLGSCEWQVHRFLAEFGEQAAPAVLTVVTSPQSPHYAVEEGLIALRFMVENAGTHPLSAATFKRIRRAGNIPL